MRTVYTFAEAVEAIQGTTFDQCRKAALVLRATGYPVTEEGYMFEEHITFLALNAERAALAYDDAETQMQQEEKALEEKKIIELPVESTVTGRTIAARAARTYELVTP